MIRGHRLCIFTAVTLAISAGTAEASMFGKIGMGLSLFDVQLSGERNLLGNGYTVNGSAFYNNRTFDFGVADLTLNGAVQGSAGYTLRGIPAVNFSMTSGTTPLSYTFNVANGIQDLTATGSVLVDIDTKINALGFYKQTLQISNRGNFATDGFGLVDSGTTDYDVGPINLTGNVYADALAALTQPFFSASGTVNPFAKFSGRATKTAELNKTADELRARVEAGEVLSDDEIATLVNNTVLAALLGSQPSDHLFDSLLLPPDLLSDVGAAPQKMSLSPAPEPTAIILLAMGATLCLRRRWHG